ncbi:MAG: deoxyribodipyrimidine photo-lyase, partial [Gammaproteobacteria bacterium]
MTAALVWFRRDLRLADNGALREALAQADAVVPVYIHDPEADGDWPPGAASRWWLHESLAQLSGALERAGSRLVVRRGSVRSVLAGLLRETGAKQVFWNHLYEPERFAADESLCKWLGSQHGVRATACAGALLAEPWTLRTGQGRPYRVFTPYWRAFLRGPEPAPPRPAPDRLPGPDRWPKGCGIDELGLLDAVAWHAGLSDHWQPGEAGAARRLARFLAGGLEHYADTRDLPALEGGVSRLSAHLHFGEISPGQVWHAVRGRGDSTGTEAYLRELGWRDFACHVLFHHPATPTEPLYSKYRDFPWRPNYQRLLDAWQRGLTGYPLVD